MTCLAPARPYRDLWESSVPDDVRTEWELSSSNSAQALRKKHWSPCPAWGQLPSAAAPPAPHGSDPLWGTA